MNYSSFSRQSLIDQLIYEGFSKDHATYAVNQVGL
ncbi:Ltp family lipoprotein [Alteribacter natronophilus]|nr:Ltp family lipoprotein [Alteribacter natronophilus]